MTLTAGFDIAIELSVDLLRRGMLANLQGGGTPVSPPFVWPPERKTPGAAVMITDVVVRLNPDDTMTIVMPFAEGAVGPLATTDAGDYAICGLDGEIIISPIPVRLDTVVGIIKAPAIDLPAAAAKDANGNPVGVRFVLSPASTQAVDTQHGPGASNVLALEAADKVATMIAGVGRVTMPLQVRETPGQNGDLMSLRFARAELHNTPDGRALVLLGILASANQVTYHPSNKPQSALTGDHDVCVSVGPQAFHDHAFCPGLRQALGAQPLPATCGPASEVDAFGTRVTRLADSLAPDRLWLEIDGHTDLGHGSSITIDADVGFELTLDGQRVVATQRDYVAKVSVSILGFPAPIEHLLPALHASLAGVARQLVEQSLAATPALLTVPLPNVAGIVYQSVHVSPEGILVMGDVALAVPPAPSPRIELASRRETRVDRTVKTGAFLHPCDGALLQYSTSEHELAVTVGVAAVEGWPSAVLQWEVTPAPTAVAPQWIPLPGPSGTVAVAGVDTYLSSPPSGIFVTRTVTLTYDVKGPELVLFNNPSDGNYQLAVRARVQDCSAARSGESTWHEVHFAGRTTSYDTTAYRDHWDTCVKRLWDTWKDKLQVIELPPEIPVPDPEPIPWTTAHHDRELRDALIAASTLAPHDRQHLLAYLGFVVSSDEPRP